VTRVLAVSQKAGDVLAQLGYGHKPVTLQGHIPLAPALEETVPDRSDHDEFRVGYVGGLTVKKGIAELIEAVGITRDRTGRDIQLHLVGPHGQASLTALANRLPWVHTPGPIPNKDVPAFLGTLDAFVMPSLVLRDHEEHDGHALLEAMAAELPSLASTSGIIPELIEHETSGLLHAPRDVETLANHLERLVTDAALRERLGRAARKSALDRAGLRSLAQQRLQTYAEVSHV
jgi:glycosyltransferase involved in cell wall biosynthesis